MTKIRREVASGRRQKFDDDLTNNVGELRTQDPILSTPRYKTKVITVNRNETRMAFNKEHSSAVLQNCYCLTGASVAGIARSLIVTVTLPYEQTNTQVVLSVDLNAN